jgi:hypothetical protein
MGRSVWVPGFAGTTDDGFRFQATNATSRSRGATRPRFAFQRHALSVRAQGKPDARCTRGLACNRVVERRTRAYRFSGDIRLSLRGSLRLIRDLLGEPCPLATVVRAALSDELDTSPWGVGTTRFRHPLQAPSSEAPSPSTASPPRAGTLRNAPLSGTGWERYRLI